MTSLTGIGWKTFGWGWVCCVLAALVLAPASTSADPLGAGSGAIFRLDPESSYQQGCFPPCLCPVMQQYGVRGTFKMRYLGSDGGIHKYAVDDVNWTVPADPPLRIVGAGAYAIGSPNVIPVLQHRMELDLRLGDRPPQHFDSGWVPITDLTKILIAVSINNMFCWDTAIFIDATRVPDDQIRRYALVPGSTFQRGCYDPCDCLLGPELPMGGTFALVPLIESLALTEFAVVDVRWHVMCDSTPNVIPIGGFGVYQLLGDFTLQHRLALELIVGNEPWAHFDSGPVIGGFEFPRIEIIVSVNGMVCFDTVLHVVAEPAAGRICGGLPGLPCDDGEFCKLPIGHCCCDYFGLCTPIPTGCPDVWDPVCGCDGVTYGNECEADMAAVSIDHYGECGALCFTSADCDASNEFCKYIEGTCGETAMAGACTPIPVGCPDVWDPVCGCDGVTYGNECEADAAAVSVRHRGPCGQVCSAVQGLSPCPNGMFCLYPEGTCDDGVNLGVCAPIPGACPTVWDPVCGCDGVTYSNRCLAHAAGVSVRHPGTCGQICWPGLPSPPCNSDEFCKLPLGICDDLTVPGICAPIPTECPEHYDPVCGCDGVTYSNECHADMAAVSIRHYGECGSPCSANADCPSPNQFCKFPEGTCGDPAGVAGVCTEIPLVCPDVWYPVCGCDGVTYGNECEADRAGASILRHGPCEQLCSEVQGLPPCPAAMFCLYPDGTCDDGVTPGVCSPIPGACPTIWDPVCGCDGVTYSNRCVAHSAGVSVRHPGTCERVCWFAEPFPQCQAGEFCKFPPGVCDDTTVPGLCTPIPDSCPEYYDPVCGCDGVTYDNECFADMAAVSIRHWGVCEAPPCAAMRMFSEPRWSYCPGLPKHVQIQLNPRPGATSYGLEDSPPAGWTVAEVSSGGVFDSVNWKVKWGPFFAGDLPRSVSYVVIPPNDATGLACFSGTVSIDGLNEPICGDGCVVHFCPSFMAADTPQPPCAACPVGDCTACPRPGCQDGAISLCEVIGYACAWKVGCNDDLAGMTRAAYIWRSGECYCWDEALQNWVPDECPPPASGLCEEGGGTAVCLPGADDTAAIASVRTQRGRPDQGAAHEVEVSIQITPWPGTSVVALDFTLPDGWDVQTASDEGQWDGLHRKVKWGPFFEDLSRTVTFKARQAAGTKPARILHGRGKGQLEGFSGMVSFDGVNYSVVVR